MKPTNLHCANAIRALSIDAIDTANSGHPGAPMGMADIAEVLWRRHLRHNPKNPNWANRDRFILSNGHGSMLIYSLLHLSGYKLSIDDLKQFRQLHSKTPGHPEYGYTEGVETTTGPLGQGLSNAVGMAIAERSLAAQFNRPDIEVINHNTWTIVGDGCLMEGISHEVCSLAGTLGLGKLKVIWDDNGISIDGSVAGWFSEDTPKRFEAYGWHVIRNVDGHNTESIENAINEAKSIVDKPVLICTRTIIGKGSPNKQGSEGVHGAPLGAEENAKTRKNMNWEHPPFHIPKEIYDAWDCQKQGASLNKEWDELFIQYGKKYPDLAAQLSRRMEGTLPDSFSQNFLEYIKKTQQKSEKIATRKASQNAIEELSSLLPELIGGSADLTHSNLTICSYSKPIHENIDGNYINYGVREFGMSAIMNGIALHGGFIPFGGTFLMFMEYARNAVRMCALMKQRSIFVYTHDSVGLGEDGPTHQPVEQLESLRCTPNLSVWRPCDSVESAVAWKVAIERKNGPSALCFSRQALPCWSRNDSQLNNIEKGAYILRDGTDALIISTGSEVQLAMQAAELLEAENISVQVVSMPSQDAFDSQSKSYKEQVIPPSITARVAIEAGVGRGWAQYVGLTGAIISISTFGESAPASDVFEHFGFNKNAVTAAVHQQVSIN